MNKITQPPLSLWQFENLSRQSGIRHFVTDRNSNPSGKEFTLSLSSSPDKEMIRENRRLLAKAMGIDDHKLFFPSQVHLTKIVNVTSDTTKNEIMETDALITSERGICIAVMSADCVPIVLYDKTNHVAAAVHSGWKGTVAKILEKTLDTLHQQYGTTGSDLVAGIGPSVSQESYEVGEEVVMQVQNSFKKSSDLMIGQPNNKAKLDLWKANEFQLREFGVTDIEISDLCTVKNNGNFFSARKGDSGRFAAGIMLL
jgi:YfiH family protein